jgi:AraC-like DNA-binding protein
MSVPELPNPAQNHGSLAIDTRDYDRARAYIRETTPAYRFSLSDPARFGGFEHYHIPFGQFDLDLVRVTAEHGFTITKEHPSDRYYFQFLLDGRCILHSESGFAEVRPGGAFVINPDSATYEVWPQHCVQLLIRVNQSVMEQSLAAELGQRFTGRLTFNPIVPECDIGTWIYPLMQGFIRGGEHPSILSDARVSGALERTILSKLLGTLPHSRSDELRVKGPTIAPYYVKRAEDFIRRHADGEITIEQIVAASCVSERSLFYGFKLWRKTTPMGFVWDVRLQMARAELIRARNGSGGTVSEVAVSAGFTSFGHFSKMYKARYGESPSATLRGLREDDPR